MRTYMPFCPNDERVMVANTSGGSRITFSCTTCGEHVDGTPYDARTGGVVLRADEAEKYDGMLRNAADDRVNQQVAAECPECGLDYMAQLRLGAREIRILVCKCGYQSRA